MKTISDCIKELEYDIEMVECPYCNCGDSHIVAVGIPKDGVGIFHNDYAAVVIRMICEQNHYYDLHVVSHEGTVYVKRREPECIQASDYQAFHFLEEPWDPLMRFPGDQQ